MPASDRRRESIAQGALPEDMTARQLRVYAQEFGRMLEQQRALNRDIEQQNGELRGRLTELVSLYRFLQEHLKGYFEVVGGFQTLARRFGAIQASDPAVGWRTRDWLADFRAQCNDAAAFLQAYKGKLAKSVDERKVDVIERSLTDRKPRASAEEFQGTITAGRASRRR